MVRKFKVKNVTEVMHHKSVEIVQSIKQDIDEYQTRVDEVIKEMQVFFSTVTETSVYHENDDFRILCETMLGVTKHLSSAIGNIIDSKYIPYMRTDFSRMIDKYSTNNKIEENELSTIVKDIATEFAKEIKNKIDTFLKSFQLTYKQITDNRNFIYQNVKEYQMLNKVIRNRFNEEIKTLKVIFDLQNRLLQITEKITQDMVSSQIALQKYIDIFVSNFLQDVWKSNTGKLQIIQRKLAKLWKGNVSEPEDPENFKDHDFFKSTLLDGQHMKERKERSTKKRIRNIDSVPLPDFTDAKSANNIEFKIDFPYNNRTILDVTMNWIQGKYTSRKLQIEITKIEKQYAFITLKSLQQETSKELLKYQQEVVHDIVSTMQVVTGRKQIHFPIRANLSASYLRKATPKLAPYKSNLRFVFYDEKSGNLCVEYINIREEIDKLDINDIIQIFKSYNLL